LLRHDQHLGQEERHEFLQAIGKASQRLETVINQLLEMSQLEMGTVVPQFTEVNVEQLVHEAIDIAMQPGSHDRMRPPGQFALDLALQETAPMVRADRRLLRHALDIVLENAVHYSPEESTILVTLRAVREGESGPSTGASGPHTHAAATPSVIAGGGESSPGEGQRLLISVRDQGIGIPAEHLARIFGLFHRVDTGLTRLVDGIGLGLAICQRIVELHGGAIWAESEPGQWSAFQLILPQIEPVVAA